MRLPVAAFNGTARIRLIGRIEGDRLGYFPVRDDGTPHGDQPIFDLATQREIIASGVYGHMWTQEVHVSGPATDSPRYLVDIPVHQYVLRRHRYGHQPGDPRPMFNGRIRYVSLLGPEESVPTFEVTSGPTIRFDEIRERRFHIVDRAIIHDQR